MISAVLSGIYTRVPVGISHTSMT